MPKRSRGTVRPGQRRPIQRSALRPGPAPLSAPPLAAGAPAAPIPVRPAGSLTAAEEARAAELELRIVAEERAAEVAQRRTRDRTRATELAGARSRDSTPLAVRAASEYAYVRRDIVRIARIGALLLLLLGVLHVLINVAAVVPI